MGPDLRNGKSEANAVDVKEGTITLLRWSRRSLVNGFATRLQETTTPSATALCSIARQERCPSATAQLHPNIHCTVITS